MGLMQRSAEIADIPLIQEIVDEVQLSFNPADKRLGEIEATELVTGFVDPAITRFTKFDEDQKWQGFISLNPDANRQRFFLDIYTRPGSNTLPENLQLAIDLAVAANPTYQLWLGVNSRDKSYQAHLESRGFELLRRYWAMEVEFNHSNVTPPDVPSGITLREIDLAVPADQRAFWEVHQDSFSKHFGFVPRDFESWVEVMLKNKDEAKLRVWLLSSSGGDLGFIECDESMSHESSGFVGALGVRQAHHGNGYGEILLRLALHTYSELGFAKMLLNVDAGNESGALRLYEKVGMKAISEWHQYENRDWSSLATR